MRAAVTSTGQTALATIAVPAELREAWERVEASGVEESLRRALYRVALGEPYRQAAKAEGFEDHKTLWRTANRHGLVNAKKEIILNGFRRVARLSSDELEQRLVDDPEDISNRDLIVGMGVAADKLAAAEGWSKSGAGDNGYGSSLERMVTRAIEAGAVFELKVTGPQSDAPDLPPREEIDVTPGRGEAV